MLSAVEKPCQGLEPTKFRKREKFGVWRSAKRTIQTHGSEGNLTYYKNKRQHLGLVFLGPPCILHFIPSICLCMDYTLSIHKVSSYSGL